MAGQILRCDISFYGPKWCENTGFEWLIENSSDWIHDSSVRSSVLIVPRPKTDCRAGGLWVIDPATSIHNPTTYVTRQCSSIRYVSVRQWDAVHRKSVSQSGFQVKQSQWGETKQTAMAEKNIAWLYGIFWNINTTLVSRMRFSRRRIVDIIKGMYLHARTHTHNAHMHSWKLG